MQIIGAGFGRTGTLSMQAAIEILGFGPCFHMTKMVAHPERLALFDAAADGKNTNWSELFSGYHSTVDWPGCFFWRELLEYYPSAQVILTVRDAESWYDSVFNTLYQGFLRISQDAGMAALQAVDPDAAKFFSVTKKIVWDGDLQGHFGDRERAVELYKKHNSDVIREVPRDQLLVFEGNHGWEPLCDFLNVPVPSSTFPHLNDSEEFRQAARARIGIDI